MTHLFILSTMTMSVFFAADVLEALGSAQRATFWRVMQFLCMIALVIEIVKEAAK